MKKKGGWWNRSISKAAVSGTWPARAAQRKRRLSQSWPGFARSSASLFCKGSKMNDERSDEKRRLLNEVFRTDSLDAFSGQLKERAWAEFRRTRFMRRIALISGAAAVLAALVAGGLFFRASERNKTRDLATIPVRTESKRPAAVQVKQRTNDSTLTDEQLLAFFPADSCFIAEVDGGKILVFRD